MRLLPLHPMYAPACLAIAHAYSNRQGIVEGDFHERGLVVVEGEDVLAYTLFLMGQKTIFVLDLVAKQDASKLKSSKALLLLISTLGLMAKAEEKRLLFTLDQDNVTWCNCLKKRLPIREDPQARLYWREV